MHQIILCNCPNEEIARKIATYLVESHLAACINILPAITSIYHWKNQIETQTEVMILIKTTEMLYSEIEASIIKLHPYDTPEIIAIPITQGYPPYLQWLETCMSMTRPM